MDHTDLTSKPALEPLVDSLNPDQKLAATLIDRHVRIVAGAGSGKTRVLMARIEYLINEIGIRPYRIMAITFTNKATREMMERLYARLGEDANRVRVSTIHSLCARILREDAQAIGYPRDFPILDSADQNAILTPVYNEMDLTKRELKTARVLSVISSWKTQNESVEQARMDAVSSEFETIAEIYARYEKAKGRMRALDFDDLLLKTRELLVNDALVREKWQNRLDYIHVDEFQDVDPIQYDIIKSLTGPDTLLCVVGDPDQTIYTWRGASVDIILHFDKDFKPSHTVILSENYRSTKPILAASNALIAHNRHRIKKDLFTSKSGGDKITLYEAANDEAESLFAARQVLKYRKKGYAYEDIAILYRSNYISRTFEKALREQNIPYQIFGGIRFYERQEIKDMLSYLRMILEYPDDSHEALAQNLSMERIINLPKRGIGEKTLEKLRTQAALEQKSLYGAMKDPKTLSKSTASKIRKVVDLIEDLRTLHKTVALPELIDHILDLSGYQKMLEEEKELSRLDNVVELKEDIAEALRRDPDLTLEEYLQDVALFTERANETDTRGVTLMTVHAAKGTEFPIVLVGSVMDGVFPSERALVEGGQSAKEEERRLMYVAMTRAKEKLLITWNTGYSFQAQESRRPSPFLMEIPKEWTETEEGVHVKTTNAASADFLARSTLEHRPSGRTRKFRPGESVVHDGYGEGVVISQKDNVVKVAFAHPVGLKQISSAYDGLQRKK